ncbi:MAG: ABC transporter permease [Methylosarcina sp.]
MSRFLLAFKLLRRDSRSGELTILMVALVIAVAGSTTVSLFADRLHRTMTNQSAEFLAADLVVRSSSPPPEKWSDEAKRLGLREAQTAEFASVLMENDELMLVSVKSVSDLYPLRGFLKVTASDYAAETVVHDGPEAGTAWVEKRILSALKMKPGDLLTIGEKKLAITRIITYETDQQGNFYSFSPRVMINAQDLKATGVIQPGSHVHYYFQLSGTEKALTVFKRWLKPQLDPSQRILDIHEDRPELGSALTRAERYLGLSSIIVIVISGIAIAMATRRYSERHFDATALLRCLGCRQREILWLYGCQFIAIGLLASALGCLIGWFAQTALFHLLKAWLPQQLAAPGLLAIFFGLITGLAVLFGFALPPLLRLKSVSALRVLRRDLDPLPTSAWLVAAMALGLICMLVWKYTDDIRMTLTLAGSGVSIVLVLGLLIHILLLFSAKLLPYMNLSWRFGLQGLLNNRGATIGQILAFAMTLAAMILIFIVRIDLIDTWKKQLPAKAPNHFALNIFPEQMPMFEQELKDQHIEGSRFYPIVRGRLVEINSTPVQQIVSKDSQGEEATHRELSLTWTRELPEDNKITAGQWWESASSGLVSVEEKLAESLKIGLGDHLSFVVGGQQFKAVVANIRALQWDTMKPNFYMIFSPGTLDAYPKTYLTSFYLPESKKEILNALVKKFPGMTVLEVDQILQQFNTILTQVSHAILYLSYFALMAAFTVLFSSVYSTLDDRIQEGALMRTLGANRRFLRKTQWLEFSLLGLISGILAVVIAEVLIYAVYHQVMHMDYHPHYYWWGLIPLAGCLMVGIAGCWGVRSVVTKSPIQVLREL